MTPGKFEGYVKKVKKEAVGMSVKNLPKRYEDCPFCGKGKPELTIEKLSHAVPPKLYEGEFYVYKCNKCKERFTTTESDTLSIASLKQKIK